MKTKMKSLRLIINTIKPSNTLGLYINKGMQKGYRES